MRFYTKQHQFYCGIDLHARTMFISILAPSLKRVAPDGVSHWRLQTMSDRGTGYSTSKFTWI